MNNPNPFLPQSSFLEQKNKARVRLKIVVFFSISLSVVALMALLIQGCRKNDTQTADQTSASPAPELSSNPSPDTNVATSNTATLPPPPAEPSNAAPQPPPPPPAPPAPPEPTTSEYTIVKGDTFATIAKKSGVSVKAMEEANPGVNARKLKIGQKLNIPAANSPSPTAAMQGATATEQGTAPEAEAAGGERTYKVKSGDTLTTIAKRFHVSIKRIESANGLKTTNIRVGQKLKIPGKAAPASAPEAAPAETAPAPVSAPVTPEPTLPPATTTNH